jgi:replication factor A1
LIILNFDVVQVDYDSKIGTPVTFESNLTSATAQTSPAAAPKQEPQPLSYNHNNFSSGSGANMQLEANLTSIKNLNPYQTRYNCNFLSFDLLIY